jgi:nucleoside-diphosphate-sugar epimerase
MMAKILITGGGGFIGSRLAERLQGARSRRPKSRSSTSPFRQVILAQAGIQ